MENGMSQLYASTYYSSMSYKKNVSISDLVDKNPSRYYKLSWRSLCNKLPFIILATNTAKYNISNKKLAIKMQTTVQSVVFWSQAPLLIS